MYYSFWSLYGDGTIMQQKLYHYRTPRMKIYGGLKPRFRAFAPSYNAFLDSFLSKGGNLMKYAPTRLDFEKFLEDTHQVDAPFFYEQWIIDNFKHVDKPLEEVYADKHTPYSGAGNHKG